MWKQLRRSWAALLELHEEPQRRADNERTATLALTSYKVPKPEAHEAVKRAHISGRMSQGEAVVAAYRALQHRGGRR
jgi:hypothetical protein